MTARVLTAWTVATLLVVAGCRPKADGTGAQPEPSTSQGSSPTSDVSVVVSPPPASSAASSGAAVQRREAPPSGPAATAPVEERRRVVAGLLSGAYEVEALPESATDSGRGLDHRLRKRLTTVEVPLDVPHSIDDDRTLYR